MQETTLPQKRSNRWLRTLMLALTLALAAGSMYLAVRKIDWNEMAATLSSGNLKLLALAAGILSLSCLTRGLRWRVLLSAEKSAPALTVFWATMTGYLGNAYLPMRAGEAVRSVLIGEKSGISKMFSLATALTERIMDAVILVAVSAVALATLPKLPADLAKTIQGMAVIGVAGMVGVFVAPRLGGLIQRIINRLPLPAGLREKLVGITLRFLTGAGALQHWGRLATFLLYTAAIWSLDTLTGLTTARAFSLNPVQVFILLAALGIASAVPSTPGYVGVYQLVAVTVLVPFGLSEAQAVAYIIGYQGVMYVVITLWGLIGLWKLRGAIRF
jgi:uncharacterized protein (TIRG00374 family)